MMHDHEKSDSAGVAMKPTNKAGQPAERRAGAEGNADQQITRQVQCGAGRSGNHRVRWFTPHGAARTVLWLI